MDDISELYNICYEWIILEWTWEHSYGIGLSEIYEMLDLMYLDEDIEDSRYLKSSWMYSG